MFILWWICVYLSKSKDIVLESSLGKSDHHMSKSLKVPDINFTQLVYLNRY